MSNDKGLTVLSLFDGMSCGQIALRELGIKVSTYYASEIDEAAIQTTNLNFPETVQLGDVRNVHGEDLPKIDLLIGGSPCQGFSVCGKHLNFEDPRSVLFFEFVRVLEEVRRKNPDVLFLLENVKMKRQHEAVISQFLGLQPVQINSALVSAQNRVRLYWTNIKTRKVGLFQELYTDIPQPKDRGLFLRDVLQDEVEERFFMSEASLKKVILYNKRQKDNGTGFGIEIHQQTEKCPWVTTKQRRRDLVIVQRGHGYNKGGIVEGKSPTVTASSWEHNNYIAERRVVIQLNEAKESNNGTQPFQQNRVYDINGISPAVCADLRMGNAVSLVGGVRRLTPIETARLQTIPDWYKWNVKETQIYKMLGNGWTVEVIKHIFSFIKTPSNYA